MLLGDTILTQEQLAFDLVTGAPRMRRDFWGREVKWGFPRSHGCGPMAASEKLITFRSGCAGFFDLENDSGTGNFGGFRSGCTSNLIAAGGVLNAPDYTRTCSCTYQNRSSLGLVYMPEVEYWTYGAVPSPGRLGINFGAPGDRRDPYGTLWFECPVVGGPSPPLPVAVKLESPRYYCHHSSRIEGGGGPHWVVASGVVGAGSIRIDLEGKDDAMLSESRSGERWRVRLHLAEPEEADPGDRVFAVSAGDAAEREIDIVKETGRRNRALVVELDGIRAGRALELSLRPVTGSLPPLLCGIEVTREE
jgi:hypothetical protein